MLFIKKGDKQNYISLALKTSLSEYSKFAAAIMGEVLQIAKYVGSIVLLFGFTRLISYIFKFGPYKRMEQWTVIINRRVLKERGVEETITQRIPFQDRIAAEHFANQWGREPGVEVQIIDPLPY